MQKPNLIFSCVLDNSPLLAVQSYIWLQNLLAIGYSPKTIYIHLVGSITREYEDYLEEKNVNIIKCKAFDERNRYCNKLLQLSTFEQYKDYDYVFLMDCDTAVLSLGGLELTEKIYAKIVDFPNPPLSILQQIFAKEGFDLKNTRTTFSLHGENISDWNNCNGGVYIIHRDFLPVLSPLWKKYALKCIEERKAFTAHYEKHADQVGFALAMASLNERVSHLDIAWNFPIHVETKGLEVDAKILHFHNQIDNNINLKKTENYLVNRAIEELNKRIASLLDSDKKLHSRDIGKEKLILGTILNDEPELLSQIVEISREYLGFFTNHFPRVFEYTWILKKIERYNNKKSVIDIGAGVCPLPLCLAKRNFEVTTVDSHPIIREGDNKEEWNEWGYLDYSNYELGIRSENIEFQNFQYSGYSDIIYSVSVIEHLPRKFRKKIIKRASNLLRKGGILLLTVDITPDTDQIWNFSEDNQVESFQKHGSIQDLKNDLKRAGFSIVSEELQRKIPFSRTDVFYIECELAKKGLAKFLKYV